MTSNNETVSRQNLWAGNIAQSMTSEGNSAPLPANVDRRLPLQRGLMNFQLQNFQLYKKSLNDWSWKRLILSQSLCVYYYHYCCSVIYSWRVFLTAVQNLRSILCLVSAFTPYTKCPCRVMNRHSIETWKSWPCFLKFKFISIPTIRCTRRQETLSMARGTQRGYSSKPLNIALLNVF